MENHISLLPDFSDRALSYAQVNIVLAVYRFKYTI